MKGEPLDSNRKWRNKGELIKEEKEKRRGNRLVNTDWEKQYCRLERKMGPGTACPPTLAKSSNN